MKKQEKKQNTEEQDDQVMVEDQIDDSQNQADDQSDDLAALQQELEELKQNLAVAQDQLRRAVADYHNLEKRVQEGRSELSSWATGELLKKLLPVLDHLEKSLAGASEEEKQSAWFKGVEMVAKQLKGILKDEGLDEIEADGQFDPSLHEAVDIREPTSAEASAGKGDNDMILEVAEKGYNLNGKVLRPAKVVVGRKN